MPGNLLMGWWFVIILLVLLIMILKYRHFKHKFFVIFLILVILFIYISASVVVSDNEVNFTSFSGIVNFGKAYGAWLINAFDNMKVVVGNVLKMDWGTNSTLSK